mgnify:CR=1 FL=1|tara:strand:- start:2233 stop:2841 length:609 start_codon:yes stop_codon:yes gene_type:complete
MGILDNRVISNRIDDVPRSCEWKARDRSWELVDTIVVHQTDSSCRDPETQIIDTADYHMSKGWCSIGYHIYIDQNGKIYQVNNLKDRGAHAGNVNDYSIGIVICGDHRLEDGNINREVIPKKQYNALVWSLAHIQNLYPQFTNIIGHTSVSTSGKSCPNLYMDELKSDVKKKRLMELITKWVFIAFLFGSIVAIGRKILYYD